MFQPDSVDRERFGRHAFEGLVVNIVFPGQRPIFSDGLQQYNNSEDTFQLPEVNVRAIRLSSEPGDQYGHPLSPASSADANSMLKRFVDLSAALGSSFDIDAETTTAGLEKGKRGQVFDSQSPPEAYQERPTIIHDGV